MLEIRHENMNNTEATQDAYNKIYQEQGILHSNSFYLWLIKLLKPVKGRILLDISCGQGRLITLAETMGLRSIGVDFAIEGVRIGSKESPKSGWTVGDGEKLPFADNSVDYITHIGSLEHFMDPAQGAKEIGRILKTNGRACIMLPNSFGLLGNILHVLKTGEIFDDGQPLQRYGTRYTWEKMLSQGGLSIEKVINYGEVDFPQNRTDALFLLKRPHKIIRYMLNWFVPVNFANQLVFICTRTPED